VRENAFDPRIVAQDRDQRNALAARGYYDASFEVRNSIERILDGTPAAAVLRSDHHEWFRRIFDVAVQAGIHNASELAGYRGHQVYISNSDHIPLPTEAVVDVMECLFDLIAGEPHAAVQAVLGHFIFVFIYPYGDGNGRMARFLMNALFTAGGYPWTVVHLGIRSQYMSALERAPAQGLIDDFAAVIAQEMMRTREENPDGLGS